MRVYTGDCDKCEAKDVEIVSYFQSAFIPGLEPQHPFEIGEICEICLSATIVAKEDKRLSGIEQAIQDYHVLPGSTAQDLIDWLESTTGIRLQSSDSIE